MSAPRLPTIAAIATAPGRGGIGVIRLSGHDLLAMARGFVTVDKLYLSGQLRLSGNLSKGFEIRYLLSPAKQRA